MGKWTFTSRTFKSKTFASGTWTGVGQVVLIPGPFAVIAGQAGYNAAPAGQVQSLYVCAGQVWLAEPPAGQVDF